MTYHSFTPEELEKAYIRLLKYKSELIELYQIYKECFCMHDPILEALNCLKPSMTIHEYDGEFITNITKDSEFYYINTRWGCNLVVREGMYYRIIETLDTKQLAKNFKETLLKGIAFGATYFRLEG